MPGSLRPEGYSSPPGDAGDVCRRSFITGLAAMALGAGLARPSHVDGLAGFAAGQRALAGLATAPHGARRLQRIGIQLYTVRTLMAHDADRTLAALARIGYTEVELAGLYGLTATEMRRLLDRHHLTAVSGHLSLADMRRDWPKALADAAALGQRYLVCSEIDEQERSLADYRRIAPELNRLGESARQHGLQFGYHNHMYEFTAVDGTVPYGVLLTSCDPGLVQMEVDLMWMVKAGGDPLRYFQRFPGRFPMVHVKDMTTAGTMVDVGQGSIDFRAIFAHADEAGIKHYFVEHDDPPHPLVDARICYDYLRQLTF